MVQDAALDAIPHRGAYAVRAPQVTDALSGPLRAAFGKEATLPPDIAASLAQLRHIRHRA